MVWPFCQGRMRAVQAAWYQATPLIDSPFCLGGMAGQTARSTQAPSLAEHHSPWRDGRCGLDRHGQGRGNRANYSLRRIGVGNSFDHCCRFSSIKESPALVRPTAPVRLGPTWSVGRATRGEAGQVLPSRRYLRKAGTPIGEQAHGNREYSSDIVVVVGAALSYENAYGHCWLFNTHR